MDDLIILLISLVVAYILNLLFPNNSKSDYVDYDYDDNNILDLLDSFSDDDIDDDFFDFDDD